MIVIHELTHAIMFLQGTNIPKEYEELLSMFNEMRAVNEMDQVVQDEWLFNRVAHRLSYRVDLDRLSDESLQSQKWNDEFFFPNYFRTINFVYVFRLHEVYTMVPEQVSMDVSNVLNNKMKIPDLLNKYDISLENEDTILCFENKIAEYEKVVNKYFNNVQRK